jgi:DNA-binding HxlR family transcriptional regulator
MTTDPYDVLDEQCPTREVLSRIADKWAMLVILALEEKTLRFSALRTRVRGVTQKMLTQTLRGLEKDGLVARKVTPTVPVTVEYSLTPLGRSLSQAVSVIRRWTYDNMDELKRARARFQKTKSGA